MDLKVLAFLVVASLLAAVSEGYRSQQESQLPQNNFHHYYGHVHNHYGDKGHEEEDDDDDDDDDEDRHDHSNEEEERIWRFQMDGNFGAYEYADANGYLRGFTVDLLAAVCKQAGKRCYYTIDRPENCWNTAGGEEYPGQGLMDQWYDGCVGYFATPDRLNAFNFTLPYTENILAGLHYKAGAEVEDPKDVNGKTIGFMDGWFISKKCFNRQKNFKGNKVGSYTPVLFELHDELVAAIKNGKVDAGVSVNLYEAEKNGLQADGDWFSCAVGGASVMSRYGDEVINWWNKAFQEIQNNGVYRRVCDEAAVKHAAHGEVHCL